LEKQLDRMDDNNNDFEIVEVVFTDEEDFPSLEERDEWWLGWGRVENPLFHNKYYTYDLDFWLIRKILVKGIDI